MSVVQDRRGLVLSAAVALVLAMALIGALVWPRTTGVDEQTDETDEHPQRRDERMQGIDELTWAPPDTSTYTRLRVTEPGSVRMEDDEDYVIDAPSVIDGPLVLRGGRNVVWIGGHIRMDDQGAAAAPTQRRALVVQDGADALKGRVVHLEGLRIDGSDLSEGINTNAPSAVVQLQNSRIIGVRFREEDDYAGTGDYSSPNHPDVVQTWGSVGELRIDGLTATSGYQGLFLVADQNGPHGPVWLRRVDLTAIPFTGVDGETFVGHRLFYWRDDDSGPIRIDNGTVWIDHHPDSRWGPHLGDNVHYPTSAPEPYGASTGEDDLGRYVAWGPDAVLDSDESAVLDAESGAAGRIYGGSPPGGSYVPEGVPGLEYRSPGYAAPTPATWGESS
jgi:hypothetical protein